MPSKRSLSKSPSRSNVNKPLKKRPGSNALNSKHFADLVQIATIAKGPKISRGRVLDIGTDRVKDFSVIAAEFARSGTLGRFAASDAIAVQEYLEEQRKHGNSRDIDVILDTISQSATGFWDDVAPDLAKAAADRLGPRLPTFLKTWPQLSDDPLLRSHILGALTQPSGIDAMSLRYLNIGSAGREAARQLLEACIEQRAIRAAGDDLLRLLVEWAGEDPWALFMFVLWERAVADATGEQYMSYRSGAGERAEWWSRRNAVLARASSHKALMRGIELVSQLDLRIPSARPSISLTALAPETRAAWRQQLVGAVRSDEALHAVMIETLLWLTSDRDDTNAQLATLDLCADGEGTEFLSSLTSHPSLHVQLRSRALLSSITGEPVLSVPPPTPLPSVWSGMERSRLVSTDLRPMPSTWLGDALVERLIEAAIRRIEERFAAEYPDHANLDEEQLGTRLFTLLETALDEVEGRLDAIATEGAIRERAALSLSYRPIPKKEEGKFGPKPERFSTDICVVIDARKNGVTFAKRASLIQAKRLYQTGAGTNRRWSDHYKVSRRQLQSLTHQSLSSYVAFYGPGEGGCPVAIVPARLIMELMDRDEVRSRIHRTAIRPAARSLADWLTFDVIGLWTGDPDDQLLGKASGTGADSPYSLIEIIVDIAEKHSEDSRRRRGRGRGLAG